jgi:hypothetical protein
MDIKAFQECVNRIKEVNAVIEKLESEIREPAFALLSEYITGHTEKSGVSEAQLPRDDGPQNQPSIAGSDLFAKHPEGKPSDNAVLIAADLYSQYGAQPFTLDEVRAIADSVGITVPKSMNMTLNAAQREGKLLFQHTGRNEYKPTVHGELYFRKKYQVSKGTKQRPVTRNES